MVLQQRPWTLRRRGSAWKVAWKTPRRAAGVRAQRPAPGPVARTRCGYWQSAKAVRLCDLLPVLVPRMYQAFPEAYESVKKMS
ncbi:hypothetical protein GCM10010278_07510 [Streptomyces melanogenes]|nr:hypothetical protein GCM10010278_07510 [Streptomyces melanogenes]